MPWYIILIIALPILFVVGMIYNALKEQKRLEKTILPKLLQERQAELERWRKEGRDLGELAAKYSYDRPGDPGYEPAKPQQKATK